MKVISLILEVGSVFCVDEEDGSKLYKRLYNLLQKNDKICISFKGVKIVTPSFLNQAIGQLYKSFTINKIDCLLKPVSYDEKHISRWNRCKRNSIIYYKH